MRWLVTLSREDLVLAEDACRRLAFRYRRDAARHKSLTDRDYAEVTAAKLELLAERMRKAREVSGS